jgi:hypothetical protein
MLLIRYRLSLACLIAASLLVPSAAFAACSTPAGAAGDQIYNSTYNVMQFCNGTNWVNMGGVSSSSVAAGSAGAVQINTGNVIDADSSYFVWDKTNHRLGIGSTTPAAALDVVGAVNSSGALTAATVIPSGSTVPTNGMYLPAANKVGFATNATAALVIDSSQNVAIGSTTPSVNLDVTGTILSRVNNAGSATAIDWSTSNVAYTSANCGAMTFTNMQDGGSYTLVVTGATSGTCSFSQSGLTFKLPVGHGATTANKHTLYSFIRAGSNVYVTWIPGY